MKLRHGWTFMNALKKSLLLMGTLVFFSACVSEPGDGNRRTNQSKIFGNVGIGEGRVFTANPAILSGNLNLDPKSDLQRYFGRPQFITTSPTLIYDCPGQTGFGTTIDNCFRVRDNANNNQLLNIMKGVTDLENEPSSNQYYTEKDYNDALKLYRESKLFEGQGTINEQIKDAEMQGLNLDG